MRFERGRGFGRRFDIPKPIKVGEEYDVEISEVGSKGDGIARIKNFVVFVNGTKKGEKAHIVIKEVRNRFAIGEKTGETEPAETEVKAVEEEATETEE
jgi:predicted RNA-binding protein with TRAM domain